MSEAAERISCLMVTRPGPERFELLRRSVACFRAQTYPNRELVVVLDEGPAEHVRRVREHLADLGGAARVVEPAGKPTLGALRNRSVAAARGALACQWDDDDLSHPTRLAEQYRLLVREGALAVALQEVLHLFRQSRRMYWTNFRNTPGCCHPGTVLFRQGARARYPEDRPNNGQEDLAFLQLLRAEGKVAYLAGAPHLYVYVHHGGNVMGDGHHDLLARALSISRGLLERRRSVFDQLACLDLGEGPLDVLGNNGPAFQLPGRTGGSSD